MRYKHPFSFLLCCLSLLLPWAELSAEARILVAPDASFEGHHQFTSQELRRTLRAGDTLRVSQWDNVTLQLFQLYAVRGFPLAELQIVTQDSLEGLSIIGALEVIEGPQFRMGTISLSDESQRQALNIDPASFLPEGRRLGTSVVQRGIRGMLLELEKQGRARTTLSITKVEIWPQGDDLLLNMTLDFGRTEPTVIERVLFRGAENSLPATLGRISHLKDGQIWSPRRNRNARKRLLQTGWFRDLVGPELALGPEGNLILVTLDELPSYRFDGLLSLLPAKNEGEKNRLAFNLELDLENLLGTGRRLNLRAARPDGISQELLFRYREPFVFNWPLGVGVEIHQQIQDSTWLSRSAALEFDWELALGTWVGFKLKSREVIPDSLNGYLGLGIDHSSAIGTTVWFQTDQRDEALNPRKGWQVKISVERSARSSQYFRSLPPLEPDQNLLKQRSSFQWLVSPGSKSSGRRGWLSSAVLSVKLAGGILNSDKAPLEELFALGGEAGPRGYREGQFRAKSWALAQLELRWLFSPAGRFYLFWDTAEMDLGLEDNLRQHGRGLGLRMPVSQGVLSLELALGEELAPGKALLHFRILSRF